MTPLVAVGVGAGLTLGVGVAVAVGLGAGLRLGAGVAVLDEGGAGLTLGDGVAVDDVGKVGAGVGGAVAAGEGVGDTGGEGIAVATGVGGEPPLLLLLAPSAGSFEQPMSSRLHAMASHLASISRLGRLVIERLFMCAFNGGGGATGRFRGFIVLCKQFAHELCHFNS